MVFIYSLILHRDETASGILIFAESALELLWVMESISSKPFLFVEFPPKAGQCTQAGALPQKSHPLRPNSLFLLKCIIFSASSGHSDRISIFGIRNLVPPPHTHTHMHLHSITNTKVTLRCCKLSSWLLSPWKHQRCSQRHLDALFIFLCISLFAFQTPTAKSSQKQLLLLYDSESKILKPWLPAPLA